MKKQVLFWVVTALVSLLPNVMRAQSTEGSDFWVTFMRAAGDSPEDLWLTFSAKDDVTIHIKNDYTSYESSLTLEKGAIDKIPIPSAKRSSCYVGNDDNEKVTNKALHIWSDSIDGEPRLFTVIAANYRDMSFDAAAIMPTKALRSEHYIECYTPTVHEGASQGTHFAIVATENNTVVDYYTTAVTNDGHGGSITDTMTTPVMNKGQVFYVWTGANSGENYDLTGSWVRARNQKHIAVFNGNPHTNIPDGLRDRDHIYSQAMPVEYWGKKFALTSSLTTIDNGSKKEEERVFLPGVWERIDKVRVMALVDKTVVYIDGDSVYTIDFSKDTKRYYEFDFGVMDQQLSTYNPDNHDDRGSDFHKGTSHFVETSCPAAVHLLLTSNRYDHNKTGKITIGSTEYNYEYCNGDPTLIWINPIEQTIKDLTFGTFQTTRVKDHFVNIVTRADNVRSFQLDSVDAMARFGVDSIYKKFDTIPGNKDYMYARLKIDNGTHHMSSDSGFIAHVYGFGLRESYGYPAGGDTKDLTAFVTINGEIYKAGGENKPICGGEDNGVLFGAELNYEYDSIYWFFGDGKDTVTYKDMESLTHFYEHAGVYEGAYAKIYRPLGEDDGCYNYSDYDSIGFIVNVGIFKVEIKDQHMPECTQQGEEVYFEIYLNNEAKIPLESDSVKFSFNQSAIDDHITNDSISYRGDSVLIVHLPATAKEGVEYGLHLHIGSQCPNRTLETDLTFSLKYAKTLLVQRYDNVLGLVKDSFPNQTLSDFVWFHDGDTIKNQHGAVLYLDTESPSGEYRVCYTIHEEGKDDIDDCACPVQFKAPTEQHLFDDSNLQITATYNPRGKQVFVNAARNDKDDITCSAEWIDVSGRVLERYDIPSGGGLIDTPAEGGFYLLRVSADGGCRSFKMFIND